MATLFNTRISDTYVGLIKTIDNAIISATLRELSDGSGNGTGLSLNNAGDFKVNAILEFGSLKDSGENIIISKFVDAADGIGNNDNDTSIPTSAAVVAYVAGQITAEDLDFRGDDSTVLGDVDLNSQAFIILGTANEIETSVPSSGGNTLKIGLPSSITVNLVGNVTGDLTGVGILSDGSTAVTQSAGDSSTKIATTKFVMDLDAGSDLDFSGDSGTGDVTLNTQSFAVTGITSEIVTTASNQGLTVGFPTTGVILPNGSTATTQASTDNSTKIATTAYVKSLDNASNLDITDGTTAGSVTLNSQSLSILGTANQVVSTVANQSVTLSLPNSINVNSASATILQSARDISLTGEASATISGFNGSANVSGAVTLNNDSVTGKVLTGLASPTATNILASDSILQAFGKTQSQLNTLAGGLRFMGTWNATTNTPTLASGGGETASGTTTGTTANKLVDSGGGFTNALVGDQVVNQASGATAEVTGFDSTTVLSLSVDIMVSGQEYTIDNSPYLTQGHYYVVSVGGTSSLNGLTNWAVGDWVIAGATNVWEKLDHTQVDGTGTVGNITKWESTNVIADSIMAESGSAASALVTVSGGLITQQGLTSTGNFQVGTGTGKFSVDRITGNGFFEGDVETGRKITIADLNYPVLIGKHIAAGNGDILFSIQGQSDNTLYSQIRLSKVTGDYGKIDLLTKKSGGITSSVSITNDTGDFYLQTGDLHLIDGKKAIFGAGNDLQIYHDGTNQDRIESASSFLVIEASNVILRNNGGTEDYAKFQGNLGVELYYNGSKKLATTNTGISVTGGGVFTNSAALQVVDIISTNSGGIPILNLRGAASAQIRYQDENSANQSRIDFGDSGTFNFINATGSGTSHLLINSSGNSTFAGSITSTGLSVTGNGYFSGRISSNTTETTGIITVESNTQAIDIFRNGSNALFDAIRFRNGNNTATNASIGYNANQLRLNGTITTVITTGGTSALTIDSSQNSTFAGEVTISAETQYLNFKKASSNDLLSTIVSETDAGTGGKLRLLTKRNGDTQLNALTLDDNQNAFFGNSVHIDYGKGYFMDSIGADNSNFVKTINSFETVIGTSRGSAAFGVFGNAGMRFGFGTNYTVAETKMSISTAGNSFFNYTNETIETYGSGVYGGKVVIKAQGAEGLSLINSTIGGAAQVAMNFTNEFVANQYNFIARIIAEPEQSWTSDAATRDARLGFFTAQNGSAGEKMRIQSDGDINITGGGRILSSAGIYLGSNNNVNLLSDYEEGTWTPQVSAPTAPTGVTYNFQSGSYTRIGNRCWVRMGVNIANVGTGGSGVMFVTGLPFTAANLGAYQEPTALAIGGRWVSSQNAGNVYAFVQNATSQFQFRTMQSNADTALNFSEIQGGNSGVGTWFTMQCFYNIA